MNSREYYWDNLKAVLIFFVVFGHFLIKFYKEGDMLTAIYLWIYTFHMPAFIFVSGYFSKTYMKKNPPNINKILGFLCIYIAFKICLWVEHLFLYGKPYSFKLLTESAAPWYMLTMVLWYIILPIFAKIKCRWSIFITLVGGILIGFVQSVGGFLCLSRTIVFFPFFMAGYFFDSNHLKKIKSRKVQLIAVITLFMILIMLFFMTRILGEEITEISKVVYGDSAYVWWGDISQIQGMFLRIIWYVVAAVMLACIMSIIPVRGFKCSYIGSRTLAIYIMHRIVRDCLDKVDIYHRFTTNHLGMLFLTAFLSLIMIIVFSNKKFNNFFNSFFRIKLDKILVSETDQI